MSTTQIQTLSSLAACSLHIRSSSTVSVEPLQWLIYTSSSPITFCQWLADGCPAPTHVLFHHGKAKFFICIVRNVTFLWLGNPSTSSIPKWVLQEIGTKLFKTHKTGSNGIPSCRKFQTLDFCCTECKITCSHGEVKKKFHTFLTLAPLH